MDKNIIIAIVLGVLLLVSVVQAVQLNALKVKVEEGKLTLGKTKSSTTTGATGHDSTDISNLPSMVGGC